jgi:hypothetical protein
LLHELSNKVAIKKINNSKVAINQLSNKVACANNIKINNCNYKNNNKNNDNNNDNNNQVVSSE